MKNFKLPFYTLFTLVIPPVMWVVFMLMDGEVSRRGFAIGTRQENPIFFWLIVFLVSCMAACLICVFIIDLVNKYKSFFEKDD